MNTRDQRQTQQVDQQADHDQNAGLPQQRNTAAPASGSNPVSDAVNRKAAADSPGGKEEYLPSSGGARSGANPGAGGIDSSRGWGHDSNSNNTMGTADVQTDIPGNADKAPSDPKRKGGQGT